MEQVWAFLIKTKCLEVNKFFNIHISKVVQVLENLESPEKRLLVLESSGNLLLNLVKNMKYIEDSKENWKMVWILHMALHSFFQPISGPWALQENNAVELLDQSTLYVYCLPNDECFSFSASIQISPASCWCRKFKCYGLLRKGMLTCCQGKILCICKIPTAQSW